jgi:hypothetical protein
MVLLQRLRVLVCPNRKLICGERIVLPYGRLPGISEDQWYWPMGAPTLTLVCPHCGLLSSHSQQDVRRESIEIPDPSQMPSVFWRVEFECGHENCGLPIVVHTRTEGNALPDEPERLVTRAKPTCEKGHSLPNDAKAVLVEAVRFAGS